MNSINEMDPLDVLYLQTENKHLMEDVHRLDVENFELRRKNYDLSLKLEQLRAKERRRKERKKAKKESKMKEIEMEKPVKRPSKSIK